MKNKYHSKKVEVGGIVFDSKKEAKRYSELLLLEKAGAITELQRQVKYILIPAQREFSNEIYTKGKNKGLPKPGKLLERECTYTADFVYKENGRIVVEDVKGYRDPSSAGHAKYIIKRKLMLHKYGIRIREV